MLNRHKMKAFMLASLLLSFSSISSVVYAQEKVNDIEVYEINSDEDENDSFDIVPIYYQNDYSDIQFDDGTIASKGNLVTCLAMLESYYSGKEITPETFIDEHSSDCSRGIKGLNSASITKYVDSYGLELIEANFDFSKACEHIKKYQAKVLLKIPHNSIFGKGTSYIILTGISDKGFIVRDPNKNNINIYGKKINEAEYIYDAYLISIAASNSSKMYIME